MAGLSINFLVTKWRPQDREAVGEPRWRSVIRQGVEMRGLAIAIVVLLLSPLTALAETAQPSAPTLAESAPMPQAPAADLSFHNVAAISIGAIAGVIVVNMVTGGMIMPILAAGVAETTPAAVPAVAGAAGAAAPAAMAGVDYVATASQIAVAAVGAVVGGYVGNWLYGY